MFSTRVAACSLARKSFHKRATMLISQTTTARRYPHGHGPLLLQKLDSTTATRRILLSKSCRRFSSVSEDAEAERIDEAAVAAAAIEAQLATGASKEAAAAAAATSKPPIIPLKRIEDTTKKAVELSDYNTHPVGSYTKEHFQQAKEILDTFMETKAQDSEAVAASFHVMMRLAKDLSALVNKKKEGSEERPDDFYYFFCIPSYYRPLIENWNAIARKSRRRQPNITLARDMYLKLQTMSRLLPDFVYDAETVEIIMDAAIHETKRDRAPVLAEDLLDLIIREVRRVQPSDLQSYVIVYNKVLEGWSDSGQPTAPVRMDLLVKNMRNAGIVPDANTYELFLTYWGKRSVVHRIEELLDELRKDGVKLTIPVMAELVDGYAAAKKTEKADAMLREMMARDLDVEAGELELVGKCIHNLLLANQSIIQSKAFYERKQKVLELAEDLYARTKEHEALSQKLRTKIKGTMMDIYAHSGDYDKSKAIFNSMNFDFETVNIMIESFGRGQMSLLAESMYESVVRDENVTLEKLNILIDAWAEAKRANAKNQVTTLLKLWEEDPKLRKLRIRPTTETYDLVLKGLSRASRRHGFEHANEILDDMELRAQQGDTLVKPTANSYYYVVKASYKANNLEKAENIMDRMAAADVHDIRVYARVMFKWTKQKTREAALRIENIMGRMKRLAETNEVALKPNAVCYNIALAGWAKAKRAPEAGVRVWNLLGQMKNDGVKPSREVFTTAISFLSGFKGLSTLEKADQLLRYMETSDDPDVLPLPVNYNAMINAWIEHGDIRRAQSVFERQLVSYYNGKNPNVKPEIKQVDIIFRKFIKNYDPSGATAFMERIHRHTLANEHPEWPQVHVLKRLVKSWELSTRPDKNVHLPRMEAYFQERLKNDPLGGKPPPGSVPRSRSRRRRRR